MDADEAFAVARRIYAQHGGAAKHVQSYEDFVTWAQSLPKTLLPSRFDTEDVDASGTVVTRHEIRLEAVRLDPLPVLQEQDGTSSVVTPQLARLRGLTYELRVFGTYAYHRCRGVQHAHATFVLVGDEVGFTFARARRAPVVDEAAEEEEEESEPATPADVPDDASEASAPCAAEPVEEHPVYVQHGDGACRAEVVGCLAEAMIAADARIIAHFGGAHDARLLSSLTGAVLATARAHGASPSVADVERALRERRGELCATRTVAAVLRDVAVRASIAASGASIVEKHELLLGLVPLLVGSARCTTRSPCRHGDAARAQECPMDRGGYFVINGTERIVPIAERREPNRVVVYTKRAGKRTHVIGEIVSAHGSRSYTLYVRALRPDGRARLVDPTIQLPFARPVPVALLLHALGVRTDRAMYELIVPEARRGGELDAHMRPILEHARVGVAALVARMLPSCVTARRIALQRALESDLLPHVGSSVESFELKARVVAHAVLRVLLVALDLAPADNRDDLQNRSVELCGAVLRRVLLQHVSRSVPNEMRISVRRQVENNRAPPQIQRTVSHRKLGEVIRAALVSGRGSDGCGISEVLSRTNAKATASLLSRCTAGMGTEKTKQLAPRKLASSQYGYMCPFETPEGQAVGLIKNLSVLAFPSSESALTGRCWQLLLDRCGAGAACAFGCKVLVDGAWLRSTDRPHATAASLRELRRAGLFSAHVGVAPTPEGLLVSTNAGRLLRPLLVVRGRALAWRPEHAGLEPDALVRAGALEYVDSREASSLLIATAASQLAEGHYTHCELHPSLLFGYMVAGMPFPDHNQSPRNVYYAAMGKQSVGVAALNDRLDTLSYALHYPQLPLVSSRGESISGHGDTAGHNPVVAIMTYMGYNQEDSVILNQSSIDRGFGHSSTYHTYRTEEKSLNGAHGERLCHPELEPGVMRKKMQGYGKIDADGLVSPGCRVVANEDVLIGKVTPVVLDGETSAVDASVVARCDGIVDKVVVTVNMEGRTLAKVRVRSYRQPEIGDKFASRHGQKGVCGMKYGQEDMPWSREGVSPDLIMNPHAIPSRMTIGHMKEALLAKVAALSGRRGDGTPFGGLGVDDIAESLHALGYQRHGCEVLYSGATGQRLGRAVFMGPGPFYQVLKHQVRDKLHSRARGPTQAVTRQPSAGRSRDGALRLGEMERDCLISHGTSALLLERLLYSSDASEAPVCRRCGFLGVKNEARGINVCRACGGTECVEDTRIPHPTKALIQELFSVGIDLRLELG